MINNSFLIHLPPLSGRKSIVRLDPYHPPTLTHQKPYIII